MTRSRARSRILRLPDPARVARYVAGASSLLLVAAAMQVLTASPAAASDPVRWDSSQERELQQQYGDIGCSVVPGFNDRCPTMVSVLEPPSDGVPFGLIRLVPGRDGSVLYGIGQELVEHATRDQRARIVALRGDRGEVADRGQVVWSKRVELPVPADKSDEVDDARDEWPMYAALSHDGSRLYVAGEREYKNDSADLDGYYRDPWVAAFDAGTGDMLWVSWVKELLAGGSATPIANSRVGGIAVSRDDRRIFLKAEVTVMNAPGSHLTRDMWHVALTASSGALDWRVAAARPMSGEPIITSDDGWMKVSPDGSRLYSMITQAGPHLFTTGYWVLAYDTETGAVVWQQPISVAPPGGPIQAPHGDMILSPDGSRVFVLTIRWYGVAGHVAESHRFLVHAYDAASGLPLWFREHLPTESTGCSAAALSTELWDSHRSLVASPSGDTVYFAGSVWYYGECEVIDRLPASTNRTEGVAVMALRADSGDIAWESFHRTRGEVCHFTPCTVALVPGPDGGDAGSRVFVTALRTPPWNPKWGYSLTMAFDSAHGDVVWQARYLDTFNDGNSIVNPDAGVVPSPDGTRLYVAGYDRSETRGWGRPLVFAYDVAA